MFFLAVPSNLQITFSDLVGFEICYNNPCWTRFNTEIRIYDFNMVVSHTDVHSFSGSPEFCGRIFCSTHEVDEGGH